jgi:hypothetical protein
VDSNDNTFTTHHSPPDVNGFNLFADKTNSLPISDQQKKNFPGL